jgi:hypothetical protein
VLTGVNGLSTIVEAVGRDRGVDMAAVHHVSTPLKMVIVPAATVCFLIVQLWLWPLWRNRHYLLLRYVAPEMAQLRNDLLNLCAAGAELHLDIHHTAYANRAIVEAVVDHCHTAGISPARTATARMAASLITFQRDNVLQDPGYGLVMSWDALMADAAAEIDQAMAVSAWEYALRDGYIAQHVYIIMFLVLDGRAFREILLIDEHPCAQAWHQQLADLIAMVMHTHGQSTPRYHTLARPKAPGNGVTWWHCATLAFQQVTVVSRLGRPSRHEAGSPDKRESTK